MSTELSQVVIDADGDPIEDEQELGKMSPKQRMVYFEEVRRAKQRQLIVLEAARKEITDMSDRVLENHAIVLGCARIVEKMFCVVLGEDDLEDVLMDIMEREIESKEASVEFEFINLLEAMIDRLDLPPTIAKIDNVEEKILFNLNKCYPFMKRMFPDLTDKKTIIKTLKDKGCALKIGRELGGGIQRFWSYQKTIKTKETQFVTSVHTIKIRS